jgi:hypothetical protein
LISVEAVIDYLFAVTVSVLDAESQLHDKPEQQVT